MKKIISIAAGAALTAVLFLGADHSAFAAADMFLKIEGIEGESTDSAHQGEIEVLAWSWGQSQSGGYSAGRAGGPKRNASGSLTITKRTDKASAALFQYNNSGQHIPKMWVITPAERGGERYLKYTLTEVIVTSFSTGGSGGESAMMEEVTFSYRKIQWTYAKDAKEKEDKYDIKEKD